MVTSDRDVVTGNTVRDPKYLLRLLQTNKKGETE